MFAIDFFCGAGGLTKGLQMADVNVVAGFDFDENCSETYALNNAPAEFIHADIRSVQAEDIISLMPQLLDNPDECLFAGCAPCQAYSQQRKSDKVRPDATLLKEFGRLIEQCLPGHIIVENVPGITKVKGYSVFRRFLRTLEQNGYSYEWDVLNAKDYGVPQSRRRMVLVASRVVVPTIPAKTHGEQINPYRTVREVIENFPPVEAGESHPEVPNHVAAEITQINLERLMNTPHDGGDRQAWPEELVLDCHRNGYQGHTDVYGRLYWDRPSPTLTGKCNSISNGRYGHPVQNRAITFREAAAIQSFPDDYIFYGMSGSIAQQIGNAVPVQLGRVLGEHLQTLVTE